MTFHEYKDTGNYTQNGEQGVINEIMRRLKVKKGVCCEFGAANGPYCSNTWELLQKGWRGTLIEGDAKLSAALVENAQQFNGRATVFDNTIVTPGNVNVLLPPRLDLLSIDCDGPDYSIWQAYTGDAKCVIIEINSGVQPWAGTPVNDAKRGTCYKPMVELGLSKGYFLVCHTGNLVFVLNKYRSLFPECTGDGLVNYNEYFDKQWL